MRLVYFAWVRERIGQNEESITVPDTVTTLAQLLDWLSKRGSAYEAVLSEPDKLRFAINQTYADLDSSIDPDSEIAIFPPVTGG